MSDEIKKGDLVKAWCDMKIKFKKWYAYRLIAVLEWLSRNEQKDSPANKQIEIYKDKVIDKFGA